MAVVRGTPNNDELFAESTTDLLLGLAGNDTLEGASGEGNNTLRGGEGNDELTANTRDKLFGEAGNDTLEASNGGGSNLLEGNAGVDQLFAGRNDILFGGFGVDYLFAGVGPSFLIGGNANNLFTTDNSSDSGDLFAIFGDIPQSPAYIFDFTPGVDRIGIGGLGPEITTFADLEFVQQQNGNTLIRSVASRRELAILVGFQAQLTQADFLFNVDLNALPQLAPGTPVRNNIVRILDPNFDFANITDPNQIANELVNINNYFILQSNINSPGKQNIEFNNVLFVSNPAPDAPNNPEQPPLGYDFSRGFLEFDINYQVLNVEQINEEIIATLILPDGVFANTYWQYGQLPGLGIPEDRWYNFIYDGTTGAEFFQFDADLDGDTDQVILLHYIKGQRGDHALAANTNNTIQTLGGPGLAANVNANLVFNQTSGALAIGGSPGVATNLQFNLDINASSADLTNEFGVFQVDNANGAIGSLNPGDPGYLEAALSQGKVIFSSLNDRSPILDRASRVVQFSSDSFLGFYLVSNGSAAEAIRGDVDNVFFSFTDSNKLRVDPANANNPLTINWEDLPSSAPDLDDDFNDLVLTVEVVGEQPSLDGFIAHPQGKIEQEVIDLTQFSGNVQVTFTVDRDADFNNFVGFYQIDNLAGEIVDSNGNRFAPGDAGYAQAAIELRVSDIQVTGVNGQQTSLSNTLRGGALYAPFIATNGNLNDVFFPFLGANSDNIDHVRLLGNNTFGFEDFIGGGDKDYNDLVVSIDFNVNVA